ncbi:MAG: hypothetical protein KatS3mg087_0862 [Patescibacteria group bacterium]|nr:MAG: hypothetical protein KatS3mg087_0862 [Patescibacteria group bacterium]
MNRAEELQIFIRGEYSGVTPGGQDGDSDVYEFGHMVFGLFGITKKTQEIWCHDIRRHMVGVIQG